MSGGPGVGSSHFQLAKGMIFPAPNAIEVRDLSKCFGELKALSSLNLNIARGTIFGLVGPNGAGKSTAIHCITGLLEPTSGRISLLGENFTVNSVGLKNRIGVMPECLALFDQLYADEFLEFSGRMYGIDAREAKLRASKLLEKLELSPLRVRLIEFSAGMRKKVAFAAAIIHHPAILFLDEPFECMDTRTVSMLKDWLREFAALGGTIFMTSHALATIESLCTAAAIMNQGHQVWESPTNLPSLQEGLCYLGRRFPTLEALYLEVTGSSNAHFDWR